MRLCNAKGPSASSSAAAIESKPKGQDERAAGSKPEGQDDAKVSKDRKIQVGDDELDELNTSISDDDRRWIGDFLYSMASQCIKAKGEIEEVIHSDSVMKYMENQEMRWKLSLERRF